MPALRTLRALNYAEFRAAMHLYGAWRKGMGLEPTTDLVCPPLDLKSRRPTRTCPLPIFKLIDFLCKVKGIGICTQNF